MDATLCPVWAGSGSGVGSSGSSPGALSAPVTPTLLPCRLCGTYPPSYNLTFLSSQNVLLVTLVTNTERRHPGFEAVFFQLPRMSSKGGQGWLRRMGPLGEPGS